MSTPVLIGIAVVLLFLVPIVGTAMLGGNQGRCVGVNADGEVVKARGPKCDRLTNVVFLGIGEDGQIKISRDTVEFEP